MSFPRSQESLLFDRFPCQKYPLEHFYFTLILKKSPLPYPPTHSQAVYEEVFFLQNDYNDTCMIWLFWGLNECKLCLAYCTTLMLIFVIAIGMLSTLLIAVIRSHTWRLKSTETSISRNAYLWIDFYLVGISLLDRLYVALCMNDCLCFAVHSI